MNDIAYKKRGMKIRAIFFAEVEAKRPFAL